MNADEPRRFSIADGLVLIAGLATGMGLLRISSPDITPGKIWEAITHPKEGWSLWYALVLPLELGVILGIPYVAAWTPACLAVQVTHSRWSRLRRQPGFVACLIATLVTVATLTVATTCIRFSIWEVSSSSREHVRAQLLGGILAGSGVLWGWTTMWLCGVCRPRTTWRDRLGRFTGAVWIVLGTISAIYIFIAI